MKHGRMGMKRALVCLFFVLALVMAHSTGFTATRSRMLGQWGPVKLDAVCLATFPVVYGECQPSNHRGKSRWTMHIQYY